MADSPDRAGVADSAAEAVEPNGFRAPGLMRGLAVRAALSTVPVCWDTGRYHCTNMGITT